MNARSRPREILKPLQNEKLPKESRAQKFQCKLGLPGIKSNKKFLPPINCSNLITTQQRNLLGRGKSILEDLFETQKDAQKASKLNSRLAVQEINDINEEIEEDISNSQLTITNRLSVMKNLSSSHSVTKCSLINVKKQQLPRIFKLGRLIGTGSFGQVYQAMDLNSGELFACKKMQLHLCRKEDINAELDILRSLKHQHIVKYIDHQIVNETVYVYQEFISQGNLLSIFRSFGTFSLETVKLFTRQILRALMYLHHKNIIHLDLKCQNIFVDSEGIIKLGDFGCSRKKLDHPAHFKGSIPWMAPEILLQKCPDTSADIWSLGCTVIEMITRQIPWSEQISFENPLTAILQLASSLEVPKLPDEQKDEELKDFLDCCLKRSPEERWTAKQLLQHPFLLTSLGQK